MSARQFRSHFRRPALVRGLRLTLKTLLVVVLCAVLTPAVSVGVAAGTLLYLPLPGNLPDENPRPVAIPSRAYDADGNVIATFRQFDLTVAVEPDEIPDVLKNAVVAAEDRRFYEHNGVDIEGTVRAARANYEEGAVVQGGSTITQQYVKNNYLTNEQTFDRKIREALLAVQLERKMNKEEILFEYLETVYYGDGAYGIGAASQVYFGKSPADLTISESALLAGVIPSPTKWSPRADSALAEERRLLVLDLMLEEGYVTAAEHAQAASETMWFGEFGPAPPGHTVIVPQQIGATKYPYFVDAVHDYMIEKYGPDELYRGGLIIQTTIDPRLQDLATAAVAERLEGTEAPLEMALASIEASTGHVKAIVGGRDWEASQVNLALGGTTGFQPGSSFKPIVLANALSQGIGPETVYPAPGTFTIPGCSGTQCTVGNYDGSGRGSMTLRAATVSSVNTVFAQLIIDVGISSTAKLAHDLGIERIDPDGLYGASLALGAAEASPLEMASVYATFANHGVAQKPVFVSFVGNRYGAILEDNRQREGTPVLSAAVADTVTSVLEGVVSDGTGKRAAIGRPVAGKTGTAQAYRAAWFVGYTPQLATSVWMGYSDASRSLTNIRGVGRVTGGSHPASAWSAFMRPAHDGLEVLDFPEPGPLPPPPGDFEVGAGVGEVAPGIGRGSKVAPDVIPDDCDGPCLVTSDSPAPTTTPPSPAASPATPSTPTTNTSETE